MYGRRFRSVKATEGAFSLAFDQAVGVFRRVRLAGTALSLVVGAGLAAMGLLVATGQLAVITRELARFNQFC